MKRYKLLTKEDILPKNQYTVVASKNSFLDIRNAYLNEFGYWNISNNGWIVLDIIEDSIMEVLKRTNSKRHDEILFGGCIEEHTDYDYLLDD